MTSLRDFLIIFLRNVFIRFVRGMISIVFLLQEISPVGATYIIHFDILHNIAQSMLCGMALLLLKVQCLADFLSQQNLKH